MKITSLLLCCALAAAAPSSFAEVDYLMHARPARPAPADPAIARALANVSPARIHQTIQTLVGFKTRNTLSSMDTDLPAGTGIQAAADWIYDQFQEISRACGGCLEVRRDVFTVEPDPHSRWGDRVPRATRLTNVYAILRGTDGAQANRMVLVTGHYDSRATDVRDDKAVSPGANDDASGVAVSLECARVLSKLRFPSSIVFVAVAGEEQGLFGSAHLAKLAKDQGWDLEAVLNNDIVGGNTTPGDTLQMKDRVRVFSEGIPMAATPTQVRRIRALGEENDSPSRELARGIQSIDRTYFPAGSTHFRAFLVDRPDRYLRGGDHMSFNQEGFAAVRFTEWREDFNHQHQNIVIPPAGSKEPIKGDLIRFVDFNYVAKVARLNAATLATLAASPGEPKDVKIDARALGNGTTLHWNAAPGKVDHYDLLWRETTAPDWQYAQRVPPPADGAPVTISVLISKDNVVFGVCAVDAKGHRGLVVVP